MRRFPAGRDASPPGRLQTGPGLAAVHDASFEASLTTGRGSPAGRGIIIPPLSRLR